MEKVIFDTEQFYCGFHEGEDCYVIGSYTELFNCEEIDNLTIQWSQFDFLESKSYFYDYLTEVIEKYEKRYKTMVTDLALVGYVGRWNGNFIGGKIISCEENPIDHMGEVDRIRVIANKDGEILLFGHHHDGCHRMKIVFLTENKLKHVAPNYLYYGDYDYHDMKHIFEELTPLKYDKTAREYYGEFKKKQNLA